MTQIRAVDLMQRDLMTVTPDTPLVEVHRLFVEEEIHGAPVVDEDGTLLGVISSMDLVRAILDQHDGGPTTSAAAYYREAMPYSGPDFTMLSDESSGQLELTAGSAMVRELVTVAPDATATSVARVMLDQRIHRVLVVDNGELVGILTTFDLLRVLAGEPSRRTDAVNPRELGDPAC